MDKVVWRCPIKRCRRTLNIRKGNFFESLHLAEDVKHELRISSDHSVVDWNQFCRDIYVLYFINSPEHIYQVIFWKFANLYFLRGNTKLVDKFYNNEYLEGMRQRQRKDF